VVVSYSGNNNGPLWGSRPSGIVPVAEFRASELAERLLYRACRTMHRRSDRLRSRSYKETDANVADDLVRKAIEARKVAEALGEFALSILLERETYET
jgi:hypothetical protein